MKYFISVYVPKKKDSGAYGKARQDVDTILKKMGYKAIPIPFSMIKNKRLRKLGIAFAIEYIRDFVNWINVFFTVEKESILVYQHPMQSSLVVYGMLKMLKMLKKINIVVLIHDLYTLRDGKPIDSWYRKIKDTGILSEAEVVICHNDKMKKYLCENGVDDKKLIQLEIFDYIYTGKLKEKKVSWSEDIRICIAGNLSRNKCGYIYQLNQLAGGVIFELYGNEYEGNENNQNCIYKGCFSADKLPEVLDQNFGLVWDGDQLDECAGSIGKYIKYNNPHKVSLYLMAGLPVIIWRKAALASFVHENGVGIVVESLRDIPTVLKNMSLDEYNIMKSRTIKLGNKLRNGFYVEKAVNIAECKMENDHV